MTTQTQLQRHPGRPSTDHLAVTLIEKQLDQALRKVAPLWPLKHFVAVNPFLGIAEQSFAEAAKTMEKVAGARMTMPRSFYLEAMRAGRIRERDLLDALSEQGGKTATSQELQRFRALLRAAAATPASCIPTLADLAAKRSGNDWARLLDERFSAWAAAYFDEGQATWSNPWQHLAPYAAWHSENALDRAPELLGLRGYREEVKQLPIAPLHAAAWALDLLDISGAALDAYLHRLAMRSGGWLAYARYKMWQGELHERPDTSALEMLAIALVSEALLLKGLADDELHQEWKQALLAHTQTHSQERGWDLDMVLQSAYEKAWQRGLIARLDASKGESVETQKQVQAAFCIDVRSERFRRAFESVDPGIETLGFAGFFGFAIEYLPLGAEKGLARCPVLLKPQHCIAEGLQEARDEELDRHRFLRGKIQAARHAWKAFKMGAISCFAFVGPVGLAFLAKLIGDSFALGRSLPRPAGEGLDARAVKRLAPELQVREQQGRRYGMDAETRLAMAEGVLRAMSLTKDFARLVLLVGHGSTSANNPHATGLDCGACGGHTGEANARVAAAVLNDPAVRRGLIDKGIHIPEETIFVAGLHDTTRDEVHLYEESSIPASHAADLLQLRAWLERAGSQTRLERAPLLKVDAGASSERKILARSKDWSQTRPEWGLAGCAAFIAAPRRHSAGLDLEGRCFLHSYEWRQDEEFRVLELILTAPVVVASWISLQYYASTVDNRVFGSGNKTLHNVVGTLGVLEGKGGDLRSGLPLQSLHDGEKFVHEPMRLNVMVAAPMEAINAVLIKHPAVKTLFDQKWMHLFTLDEAGKVSARYVGDLRWRRSEGTRGLLAA